MAIIVFKSSAQTIYALRSCSILFANLFTIGILLTAPASKVWNLYQTLSHCSDLYSTLYILELVHIYLENPWLENNLIWTNSSGVLYYLVVYLLTDFWLRSLNLLFIFKFFNRLFVLILIFVQPNETNLCMNICTMCCFLGKLLVFMYLCMFCTHISHSLFLFISLFCVIFLTSRP